MITSLFLFLLSIIKRWSPLNVTSDPLCLFFVLYISISFDLPLLTVPLFSSSLLFFSHNPHNLKIHSVVPSRVIYSLPYSVHHFLGTPSPLPRSGLHTNPTTQTPSPPPFTPTSHTQFSLTSAPTPTFLFPLVFPVFEHLVPFLKAKRDSLHLRGEETNDSPKSYNDARDPRVYHVVRGE